MESGEVSQLNQVENRSKKQSKPLTSDYVDRIDAIESAGDWVTIADGMGFETLAELRQYIEGLTVVDVGSGMGGLAKEVYRRSLDKSTKVFSVNPRLKEEGVLDIINDIYLNELVYEDFASVPERVREMNDLHSTRATAALSDRLPFPRESVDIVMDHKGAVYHLLFRDEVSEDGNEFHTHLEPHKDALINTLHEYGRVLRSGGKA